MARRVSLPAADDLFRQTTGRSPETDQTPAPPEPPTPGPAPEQAEETADSPPRGTRARQPSGRVRHDEKMTVYVTAEELLELEHARLLLRRDHGLALDRGRLVREAVALTLADLDARGEESVIVQRLNRT